MSFSTATLAKRLVIKSDGLVEHIPLRETRKTGFSIVKTFDGIILEISGDVDLTCKEYKSFKKSGHVLHIHIIQRIDEVCTLTINGVTYTIAWIEEVIEDTPGKWYEFNN